MCHLKATMSLMKACTVQAAVLRNARLNVPRPAAHSHAKKVAQRKKNERGLQEMQCWAMRICFWTSCTCCFIEACSTCKPVYTFAAINFFQRGNANFCSYILCTLRMLYERRFFFFFPRRLTLSGPVARIVAFKKIAVAMLAVLGTSVPAVLVNRNA